MNEDHWEDMFEPMNNHITGDEYASHFETYGEELDYVLQIAETEPERVWTYQDDDYGVPCITSGYHYVNRIGYYITKKPRKKGDIIYVRLNYNDAA
jgi:hypothetical protein